MIKRYKRSSVPYFPVMKPMRMVARKTVAVVAAISRIHVVPTKLMRLLKLS